MKKSIKVLALVTLVASLGALTSCGGSEKTIRICASEIPHAKILNECIKPLLKEEGYELKVKVLDWTQQNSAVAQGDYDANYFQHIPYLNNYNASVSDGLKLTPIVKVHYERLCMYAEDTNHKTLTNGDKIALVDDQANLERALKLLEQENVLTIKDNAYVDGIFSVDVSKVHDVVTLKAGYENVKLKCMPEATMCQALTDYNFGILSGNTAMLGLQNYQDKIVFGENSEREEDEKANVIAVRKADADAKTEKVQVLTSVFAKAEVSKYIEDTFGASVVYHYINLLK